MALDGSERPTRMFVVEMARKAEPQLVSCGFGCYVVVMVELKRNDCGKTIEI